MVLGTVKALAAAAVPVVVVVVGGMVADTSGVSPAYVPFRNGVFLSTAPSEEMRGSFGVRLLWDKSVKSAEKTLRDAA